MTAYMCKEKVTSELGNVVEVVVVSSSSPDIVKATKLKVT